ncbi:MAG: GEVED domain-containing protein [Flavobacteriia bacterium]|nr:GEVED domain-containing protein [Flavobacteriia bacterium]
MPRYPLLSLFRSGGLVTALFLSIIGAHGQAPVPHQLFDHVVVVNEAALHSDILANAELRMRLVQLVPNAAGDAIDLSVPLDLELFPDVRYTVQLRPDQRSALAGLEVWKGRVGDARFDHLPRYVNTVFVLNRGTGRLVANIETEKGFFQVLPVAGTGLYRVRHCKPFDGTQCRVAMPQGRSRGGGGTGVPSLCDGACREVDPQGRYVVDVFAGYSPGAALLAGDVEAHAQANIETVNTGLANSQVDTLFLRLVGTGVGGENPGIVTSVLDDGWDWFAPQIEALAPDLIALFQTPTNDPGSAGGWGSMPGRATVNGVEWPTVFRHEAGHNSGGNHCFPDNENYRNGWDNTHWRTHMCGNDVNFYSTPLLQDDLGNAIGHPDQADMARNWNEMAFTMATYGMHRVPFFAGDTCIGLPCLPEHWGGPIEYISHVRFNELDNWQTDPAWNCPMAIGYSDYTDLSTEVAAGSTHQLLVESTTSWDESTLRAWIDWDGNGAFAPDEVVLDQSGHGPWATQVTVPADAASGPVRLRIRLQYGLDQPADPCSGSGYSSGESEDYTVVVTGVQTAVDGQVYAPEGNLAAYPNPTFGQATLEVPPNVQGSCMLYIRDLAGRCVRSVRSTPRSGRIHVDMAQLPAGSYTCELHHAGGLLVARLLKR